MSLITLTTNVGDAMLTAFAAGGEPYSSAIMVVGDGNGTRYVLDKSQTSLVNEVWRGAATITQTEGYVIFNAEIPANVGGFYIREVGVLLGNSGSEQLFIISQWDIVEKRDDAGYSYAVGLRLGINDSQIGLFPTSSAGSSTLALSRTPHITVDLLVSSPPSSPTNGTLVAISTGASGLFVGKGGYLAERIDGAWAYDEPPAKSVIRTSNNGKWYGKEGNDWVELALEEKQVNWADVQGKPATFTPSSHNHSISEVTGLQIALDGKVAKAGDVMSGSLKQPVGTASVPSLTSSSDATSGVFYPVNNTIALSTAGTERFRVGAAGQLGIGGANFGNAGDALISQGASLPPIYAPVCVKAWLQYKTSPVGIQSSYNISSVGVTQDIASLDITYRINFITPLPNNNYAVFLSSKPDMLTYESKDTNGVTIILRNTSPPTTVYEFSLAIIG